MRALKSIRLKNFQSHKDTLISFAGPGCLTVITGPSDSGKSAVIRALRWVFYNMPQGDGFIFNAEDKCTVTLEYDDGTKVERIRSRGGINRYVVNGQVFEGFGTGVPLEVQQATGIRKLEIGDQTFLLNLSEQLDGPFLGGKSVSGPARAKMLGKLAGTEEIDYASKEIGTDIYRAKRQKEDIEKEIEDKQKQLNQYSFIPAWERVVAEAETVLSDTKNKVVQIEKLKNLSATWKELCTKKLDLEEVVYGLRDVDKALGLVVKAQELLTKGNTIATLRGKYLQATFGRLNSENRISILSKTISEVSPLIDKVAEDSNHGSRIKELSSEHERASRFVKSLQWKIEALMKADSVNDYLKQAFNDNVQREKLDTLSTRFRDASMIVKSYRNLITSLSNVDYAVTHLDKATQDSKELAAISKIHNRCLGLADLICLVREENRELVQSVQEIESEYLDFMASLGKCPTCGGDIDAQKLREVI